MACGGDMAPSRHATRPVSPLLGWRSMFQDVAASRHWAYSQASTSCEWRWRESNKEHTAGGVRRRRSRPRPDTEVHALDPGLPLTI